MKFVAAEKKRQPDKPEQLRTFVFCVCEQCGLASSGVKENNGDGIDLGGAISPTSPTRASPMLFIIFNMLYNNAQYCFLALENEARFSLKFCPLKCSYE
jgi:hypothetical protein